MDTQIRCSHPVQITPKDGQTTISSVPVVQELSRQGLQHLPDRFILSSPPPPALSNASPPTIDMSKFTPDSDPHLRDNELRRLADAASDWGMFFVTNHSVSPELMSSLSHVIKGFFNLSFEEKKGNVGSYFDTDNLGYGKAFVKTDYQTLDWMDRFSVRVTPSQDHLGLKLWPTTPADFRRVIENYSSSVSKMSRTLLGLLSESFGLERDSFVEVFEPSEESIANLRINYYPPVPAGIGKECVLGLTGHTDGSAVTVLAQFDGTDGLEVRRPEGWVRVPAPEGALLVVAGDLLEILSNGRVESPWHRAATRSDRERYSVAWFYYPPENADVTPVVCGGDGVVKFRKVKVGEYLKRYYELGPIEDKSCGNIANIRCQSHGL